MTAENESQLLDEFLGALARPEEALMPLFWRHRYHHQNQPPANAPHALSQSQLRQICQVLFAEIERLGRLYDSITNKQDTSSTVLSGLDELFVESEDSTVVDAETLWGQIDLQNHALHRLLKSSVKKLSKTIEKGNSREIRLLDLENIRSDEESASSDEDNLSSENGDHQSSSDEADGQDQETKRIRSRMERAMAEIEEESDDDEKDTNDASREGADIQHDEESLEDPAAVELNDGFFDIGEMEAFADEEEQYLPDEAFGTVADEQDSDEPKKSFHQRQREGHVDSGAEDDDNDDFAFRQAAEVVRRRKYREDDEIQALYSLYQKQPSDDEDSVVNMTAEDLFGKPDKKYLDQWNKNHKVPPTAEVYGSDTDSWDSHDFNRTGPGWRDDDSGSKEVADQADADTVSNDSDEKDPDRREVQNEATEPLIKAKTLHGVYADKLLRQTEALERELLAEKPWQMTGESKGSARPVNSLLEAAPEFEVATKMAPIVTVEHTANLEDVIRRRIISEDWDDVVPRELPDVGWTTKKGELPEVSQEKSKLGLGELYEREFLKKAVGYDVDSVEKQSEEEKSKNEMKALFANLCSKLDALSNYHFAPRPIAEEAELRPVTTPAIAMEEVMPLHVSGARAVAPEEVYGAKQGRQSVIRGETELDQVERKRLRVAKKAARRKARKQKLADEKLLSRLQPGLGLNNPYEKRKMREELSMAWSRGKIASGERDANVDYGASGKFFKRMQEEAEKAGHGFGSGERKRKRQDSTEEQKSRTLKL